MSIYKDCDIRGEYGRDLFDTHAERLGQAVAQLTGAVNVIVAGDGRLSTDRLKAGLMSSLAMSGCRVVDLGQVATPVFYFARQYLGIETGVMVTASHNPAGDNGFKIILGALPINSLEMEAVQSYMEGGDTTIPKIGGEVETLDILPVYLSEMEKQMPQLPGLKVVVDCANGMATPAARSLWEASGAEVTFLFDEIDGRFPNHPPNPAQATNLVALGAAVREKGAELGIAYDGDGDRVAFLDERGKPISNDHLIVLFARAALRNQPSAIVYDQKCSWIVREAIEAEGGMPVMERSGHTFIKTTFIQKNAPYAGELSGHHFFRSIRGDDGVMASLFLAGILVDSGKNLSEAVRELPVYPITPDLRIAMDSTTIARVLRDLEMRLAEEAILIKLDGVRLEYKDGWGIARSSVTEPMITLRFEGRTQTALQRVMQRFEEAAPDLAGRLAYT